jgi:hypothetical protein
VEGDNVDGGCTVEGAGDVNKAKIKEWPSVSHWSNDFQPLDFWIWAAWTAFWIAALALAIVFIIQSWCYRQLICQYANWWRTC